MEQQNNSRVKYYQSLDFFQCNIQLTPNINSFTQKEQIRLNTLLDADTTSFFKSRSVKYLPLNFHHQSIILCNQHMGRDLEGSLIDKSPLAYLSLSRGISENYEYFQQEQQHLNFHSFNFREGQIVQVEHPLQGEKQQGQNEMIPSQLSQLSAEQEFKSKSKYSDLSKSSQFGEKVGSSINRIGLKVTKNVTKNIGKILFKFIWKHRRTLGQDLKIQKSRWEQFIKVITLWKKQNNITRQYLISRWHGQGQDSALFRIISRHFFRKRCLAAILKSHIRLKRVHYQRINRYSSAITDPTALDSIA